MPDKLYRRWWLDVTKTITARHPSTIGEMLIIKITGKSPMSEMAENKGPAKLRLHNFEAGTYENWDQIDDFLIQHNGVTLNPLGELLFGGPLPEPEKWTYSITWGLDISCFEMYRWPKDDEDGPIDAVVWRKERINFIHLNPMTWQEFGNKEEGEPA